jgi:protein disulfide-isomerase A1
MNNIILFFCLISLITCKERYQKEGDVLVLDEHSFGFAIREFKYILVLFYDPECPHCQNFMPEYGKMATDLKKEFFVFAKLNAVRYEKIANNYDLEAFPTLILLKNQEKFVFEGGRTRENIENFLKEKTKENFKNLKDKVDFERVQLYNKPILVYFGKDEKVIDELNLAYRVVDNVIFTTSDSEELIKENIKQGSNDNIIIFKEFDDRKNIFKGKITAENIINFCNLYSYPKILEFNKETSQIIFTKRKPSLILFSEKGKKHYEIGRNLLNNIWNQVQGKMQLFLCHVKDDMSQKLAEFCGIKKEDIPKVMIIDPRPDNPKKYEVNGDLNEENILSYINKFWKGELKLFLRSEKIPEKNDGDIFVLVGNNFQKEVLDNDKDVLVYFYSSQCRICKDFEPLLEELAKKWKKNNPKLLIAKMNGILNDVDEYQIQSFPSTKFYPGNAKDKEPKNFHTRRNITSLIRFIKNNAIHKIIEEDEPQKNTDL